MQSVLMSWDNVKLSLYPNINIKEKLKERRYPKITQLCTVRAVVRCGLGKYNKLSVLGIRGEGSIRVDTM
jgi:hypothetical protein